VMGVRPEPEADLAGAVRDLAACRLSRDAFLERFGHRGSDEMELSNPRWAEAPGSLPAPGAAPPAAHAPPSPAEVLAGQARLSPAQRALILDEVAVLHTYLSLRESAKHHLMLGYAVIRRALLEIDRRFGLHGGVFYLTPEELPRARAGEDLSGVVAARRRRRALALGLEAPAVIFSDDLEAVGRPMAVEGAAALAGVPLSAGVAEGPALVLERPELAGAPPEGFVLVCPSTDPAWVPLFVRATALVMETGGVLSHGAIVAREFGLPAVAGLPGITRQIRTGDVVRVDGARGTVVVISPR
jgi:phosphohistidine swiveling domain-containing protein